MSWFSYRFNRGISLRSYTCPSTMARTNPSLRALSKTSLNCPFRPRTRGATTWTLVPSLNSRSRSTIWVADCRRMGRVALGAMRCPRPRIEEPEVVVDLGHRAYGGPRVPGHRLLLDRDGGRESVDAVDIGLLHQPQELARVGREGLHIPALSLGIDRIERQGGLPRAREPRDHHEAFAGDLDGDVLEVVLARSANDEGTTPHVAAAWRAESERGPDSLFLPSQHPPWPVPPDDRCGLPWAGGS